MNSIAQAASRCSRHGEAGMTKTVYLVNIKDVALRKLWEIERGRDQTIRVLEEFRNDEKSFGGSFLSSKLIKRYFYYYYLKFPGISSNHIALHEMPLPLLNS